MQRPSRRHGPPFRADHVGSLLRPAALRAARLRHAQGLIDRETLRIIEDREIEAVIRRQEDVGLELATDGEFRRASWQFDFLRDLRGVETQTAERGIQFKGIEAPRRALGVNGRLDFVNHPMLDHFRFLKERSRVTAKLSIPSPAMLHFRARDRISIDEYPDIDEFFDDLARTYRKALGEFYEAGCRYLQLDDTTWGYLCSDEERTRLRQRGEDPDRLPAVYARVVNQAICNRPHDLVVTTHVCRGNFRSSWITEGGYEPIAEVLFTATDYDGYFLEYDSVRAGGFEPLRFLPAGNKKVVLGLVSSKLGTLECRDSICGRIKQAAEFVALDQLCLSPQCGFASTEEGNILAEQEQWSKLEMIVEIARQVWQ